MFCLSYFKAELLIKTTDKAKAGFHLLYSGFEKHLVADHSSFFVFVVFCIFNFFSIPLNIVESPVKGNESDLHGSAPQPLILSALESLFHQITPVRSTDGEKQSTTLRVINEFSKFLVELT